MKHDALSWGHGNYLVAAIRLSAAFLSLRTRGGVQGGLFSFSLARTARDSLRRGREEYACDVGICAQYSLRYPESAGVP